MKKVRVITAEEAALMVKDGDTVSTGGFVSCACPEALTKALENRFVETGHPRDLTLFFAAGQGHRTHRRRPLRPRGYVQAGSRRSLDRAAKLGELALANKLEAYNLPQGVITHMLPRHRRPQHRHHHPRWPEHLRRPPSRGWQAQRVHQGRPGEAGEH